VGVGVFSLASKPHPHPNAHVSNFSSFATDDATFYIAVFTFSYINTVSNQHLRAESKGVKSCMSILYSLISLLECFRSIINERQTKMSSANEDILSKGWGYVIGGLGGLVVAVITIIVVLCRQHARKQAIKDQQQAARSARILKLQQQSDSFTNIGYRADTDILTRLGMSQLQPNPIPSQDSHA
jgi:hypothetical protein